MNQESVDGWLEDSKNDGMLLSPTDAPILMARVHVAAFRPNSAGYVCTATALFGSTRTSISFFFLMDRHVTYSLDLIRFFLILRSHYGDSLENLVAEDENGFLYPHNLKKHFTS